MQMTLYDMPQVCRLLGQPYHRIYYAVISHQIEPMRAGRSRLFTMEDVEALKRWFASKDDRVKQA